MIYFAHKGHPYFIENNYKELTYNQIPANLNTALKLASFLTDEQINCMQKCNIYASCFLNFINDSQCFLYDNFLSSIQVKSIVN